MNVVNRGRVVSRDSVCNLRGFMLARSALVRVQDLDTKLVFFKGRMAEVTGLQDLI